MYKLNNSGFSLIELMITVAIIGVLSSVAIPNFLQFRHKARQAEAKSHLGAIFTGLKIFKNEHTSYFGDFRNIGHSPEGTLYYQLGFEWNAGSRSPVVPASYFGPGVAAGGEAVQVNSSTYCNNSPGCIYDSTYFCGIGGTDWTDTTFVTRACMLWDGVVDNWSMDEGKILANAAFP